MENIFGEGDLPPWKPLQMSMKICDRAIYHSKLSVLDQIMLTVTPPTQKQPNSTCGLCIWNTMHVRIKKYMYNVHVWLVYSMSPTEWKGHLSNRIPCPQLFICHSFTFVISVFNMKEQKNITRQRTTKLEHWRKPGALRRKSDSGAPSRFGLARTQVHLLPLMIRPSVWLASKTMSDTTEC